MRNIYVSVLIGILLTPILYMLAAFFSGGGHSLTAVIVAFPYGLLWGILFKDVLEWTEVVLISLQFPIYGWVLGSALRRNLFKAALIVIAALHVIATSAALVVYHYHRSS